MTLQALPSPRFVRRTCLGPNEYRKNFHQIDRDVLAAVTSDEADRVTPLMSKIYLRLVNAPDRFWERAGVLRIEAEERGEQLVKAWVVLCDLVGVSSATASKALRWLHEQGIIGYFAGKNGVGLRIFINRASSSIGVRTDQRNQKILSFPQASSGAPAASPDEAAFNDSFAVLESSDTDMNSRAPKSGAENERAVKTAPERQLDWSQGFSPPAPSAAAVPHTRSTLSLDEVVARLKAEIGREVHAAALQAAASEHERTREWLESRGLPKAARVAQHEAYSVLRKYGVISESARASRPQLDVGRNTYTPQSQQPLTEEEVSDLAQACVAMLEAKGQPIEVTLSGMSVEAGGFLLAGDAGRVREQANVLLSAAGGEESERGIQRCRAVPTPGAS